MTLACYQIYRCIRRYMVYPTNATATSTLYNIHFFTRVGSIFFLFFLGGYYFYVNIFYKDMVVDVLLLLLHYWQLGVISKCRRFYQYIRVEDKRRTLFSIMNYIVTFIEPLELQLRSETKEEFT
ncbi:unnamed protein product [Strongylus vulgaris]|uniref:Uncharacterized protein n=1 Tax=Strongylus vulgaris TaxID=40348 RepID=A0A3P7LEK9_STRVU|nr:unnamed protein product [Strongylus vulgaris]